MPALITADAGLGFHGSHRIPMTQLSVIGEWRGKGGSGGTQTPVTLTSLDCDLDGYRSFVRSRMRGAIESVERLLSEVRAAPYNTVASGGGGMGPDNDLGVGSGAASIEIHTQRVAGTRRRGGSAAAAVAAYVGEGGDGSLYSVTLTSLERNLDAFRTEVRMEIMPLMVASVDRLINELGDRYTNPLTSSGGNGEAIGHLSSGSSATIGTITPGSTGTGGGGGGGGSHHSYITLASLEHDLDSFRREVRSKMEFAIESVRDLSFKVHAHR